MLAGGGRTEGGDESVREVQGGTEVNAKGDDGGVQKRRKEGRARLSSLSTLCLIGLTQTGGMTRTAEPIREEGRSWALQGRRGFDKSGGEKGESSGKKENTGRKAKPNQGLRLNIMSKKSRRWLKR